MKPQVLCLFSPWHRETAFRPETWEALCAEFEVVSPESETEAEARLPASEAALTGWGTSFRFTRDRLLCAPRLRLIAHTAGSVKKLFPDAGALMLLHERHIAVYSGVEGMARNVAEATVACLIMALRRWPEHVRDFPGSRRIGIAQPDDTISRRGQYLTGATVGLVGLSTVARYLLPLICPFGCRILVYDPYLSEADAERYGVEQMELDNLFRLSDVVSLHAPALPSTRHMIGARQLSLLRDGAALVNTARGTLLDHDALYTECRGGRISVVLDVTDPEPLPEDSPLWNLPNVFLLPHIAGVGDAGLFQMGDGALAALRDVFAGRRPASGIVPLERWETIA